MASTQQVPIISTITKPSLVSKENLSQEALAIFQKVKKLQRIFLLINRESKMSNKIKVILDKNLKEYQNLSIYEILNIQNLNDKFLKMGKILFLLNYLCSHKKILVSYAIKFLSTIEEDIKKVHNFKLENFFAFENKLTLFQKILFESLSQQNLLHPELFKEENAAPSPPNDKKEPMNANVNENHKPQDELKDLIAHLFANNQKMGSEIAHDDHTTVDLKKNDGIIAEKEETQEKSTNKQSFKRRKYVGKNEKDLVEEFDALTQKKKINI